MQSAVAGECQQSKGTNERHRLVLVGSGHHRVQQSVILFVWTLIDNPRWQEVASSHTSKSPKGDEARRGVQECRAQGVTAGGCQRSKGAGKGRGRVHLGGGHHRAQHQRQKHVEHTCNGCRPNNTDGNVNRGILHLHRVILCTSDMPCWITLSMQAGRACTLQTQWIIACTMAMPAKVS